MSVTVRRSQRDGSHLKTGTETGIIKLYGMSKVSSPYSEIGREDSHSEPLEEPALPVP